MTGPNTNFLFRVFIQRQLILRYTRYSYNRIGTSPFRLPFGTARINNVFLIWCQEDIPRPNASHVAH